jgi:hypothetical protein
MGWIILAIVVLAIVGWFVLKAKKTHDAEKAEEAEERAQETEAKVSLSIDGLQTAEDVTMLKSSDILSIQGADVDFSDLNLVIDRVNKYECGGDEWFEVSGTANGKRRFIEFYEDDNLTAFLVTRDDIPLGETGLSENDLGSLDHEQDTSNSFDFDGETWYYVESNERTYYKGNKGSGESFYGFDFTNEDNSRSLYIEAWEGEPPTAGLSVKLTLSSINVMPT